MVSANGRSLQNARRFFTGGLLCVLLWPPPLLAAPLKWLRGNTHAHTILCGHGDTTPEAAARWYYDNGYNFLVLSEHNIYIDPASIRLPSGPRRDFLLIGGQEVTQGAAFGARVVHVTAFGTRGLVDWASPPLGPAALIQKYVNRVRLQGGLPILNHPNLSWSLTEADIFPVTGLSLFELYNGHPHAANGGNTRHPSTEALWDRLLTRGRRLYGVGSDDAHLFRSRSPGYPHAGRAWIMVRSQTLTQRAITEAMEHGDFYTTTGVALSRLRVAPGRYTVGVDMAQTESAIRAGLYGDPAREKQPSVRIQFFGRGGRILRSVRSGQASLHFDPRESYVRAKVTVTRRVPFGYRDTALREFYAWTQPIFGKPGLRP